MKKWLKTVLWVAGVLLALLVLLSLLAGPVAKGYVNKHGEDLVGRRVQVGHVGLNLFTGHVAVRDLAVYEDDAEQVFAGFDTLDVNVHLLKIPFKTLHFGHITLSGLHADVKQQGERFNFSSLIEHFASDDTTADTDTTPSGWTLKFYNIGINHASLNYDDLRSRKGIHLPDVNLRVPGFVLGGDEGSEGGLNIGFDRGGRLNVDAAIDGDNKAFRLDVNLVGFDVQNLGPFLADMLAFERLDGAVEAHLVMTGRTDEIMQSRIGGTVALKGLDLAGEVGEVASVGELAVTVDSIVLDRNLFDIAEVRIDGLKATYAQWKDYSNIDRLLAPKGTKPEAQDSAKAEEPAADSAAASQPLQLHVGSVRVNDATLTYDDHTLPDPFHFVVSGLNIGADNLTTSGSNNAQLRASLPGGGHLAVRWQGDIDNWKRHQDLFLTIKGLDMKQLSPWAVAYTGQPIEDGIFGLTTRLTIVSSNLDNQNKIDIYKARVGSRRADVDPELKIPLKAALYVLKDKDDKILIDMPVSGNVDNPEFSYMKVVWKTLGNLLVKVATSPARALGAALGINGDELEFLAVEPGQRGLTSEQYHTLGDIAAIVQADSLVCFTLERQMPAAEGDTASHSYDMLDRQIRRYLDEQGVGEDRVRLTAGSMPDGGRSGYAIGSEMKID